MGCPAAAVGNGQCYPDARMVPLIGRESSVSTACLHLLSSLYLSSLGRDFSYTRMPHKKVQLTAGLSFVYSLILLVLAVAADRFVGLAYIAALFSPIGHELVVYLSRHSEVVRNALFSLPRRGVRVLDVLAKSQSFEKGVRAGDVILTVNGVQVSNVESVRKPLCSRADY